MKAAVVERLDGPGAFQLREVPDPRPGDGDVLIEVRAAGVVFPDVLKSLGKYQDKPSLPYVGGHQVAGVVASAPVDAAVRVGDRVVALTVNGAFAEQTVTDPGRVFPLPARLSFEQGAAIPINYLTTHFAYRRARLQRGETVLVHGAAGGLGSVSVQFAQAMGARVIAVASTPEKATFVEGLGADHVIGVEGFRESVGRLTGGSGVDVVVDPVGGDRFTDSLRSLAPLGRLVVLGFVGGEIPAVKVNRLLLNNIDLIGVAWGEFWMAHEGYQQQQWSEVHALLESGRLEPVIGATFPLSDAGQAVAALADRKALGSVVVTVA